MPDAPRRRDEPSSRPTGTPIHSWPFDPLPPPHLVGDDDARAEIDAHIELLVDELVAAGHPLEQARREARERFGDPVAWHRRTHRTDPRRSGMTTTMMTRFLQDFRFALRSFRRSPGFAVMAVLTLTVALAGNTALFSVLDSAVLQALPFPDSDRLVFIDGVHRTAEGEARRMASVPEFRDWRERARTVESVVATAGATLTLAAGAESERVPGEMVSEGYFELLGGEAALGRTFSPDEYTAIGGPLVAVLGHDLWERAFGADRSVVGRTVTLDERTVEVIGVMEEGFGGVNLGSDLWLPLPALTLNASADIFESRGSRFLPVLGRLAPGSDLEQAQSEFESIALQLQQEFPGANEDRFARLTGFREGYLDTTGDLLWVLFGAGLLLVVIAGANVANLLLVRAHARTREITVRRAVGADSARIVGQLLTESLTLAAVGGALGLVGAQQLLRVALPLVPEGVLPAYAEPAISLRAFGFTLVVLLVVGVLSGLTPAMASARRDLAGALRSGRGSVGRGNRAQKAFVVTQMGLALLLLVGAGLLTRSLRAQLAIDPGLEVQGLHALRVSPPLDRYPDPASLRLYADEIRLRVAEVPGVGAVTLSSDVPFRGGSSGSYAMRPDDVETLIRVHRHSVDPGFFDLLGVEVLAGRVFQSSDDADAPGVVVVSRAFVERVFPEDPAPAAAVGRQVWAGNPNDPDNLAEIVGVVDNVRFRNLTQSMLDGPNSPDLFYALAQVPARTHEVTFAVDGDEAAAIAGARRAVQSFDPSTPPFALASLSDLYLGQTAMPRLAAVLMGAFSLLALSLAAVGIYGVLSFTVHQRASEIALRRALGAEGTDVARRVVVDAVRLAGLGVVIGGVAAFLAGDLLESLLFQVQAGDPVTLVLTGAALLAVAAVAAAVPALRAARREPAEVLRRE
ncbi:ADOP family duplicated permease [Gemmatimonadota bacterium Y43]